MNFTKWSELARKDLSMKYNSINTVDNYHSCIKVFLNRFEGAIDPQHICNSEIKDWLLEAKTINTRKHRLNALRFFYKVTVGMPNKVHSIPYPKSEKKLPIVLSQQEIQKMFDACDNLKHKTILAILYSCGLRVSELINLKWIHINRANMVINIVGAKGNKDRQVPLNTQIIELLTKYYYAYRPKEYVFNGQGCLQYSDTSVGNVVKQLAEKAGIKKRVYTHLIRHCSFTHLLEEGTELSIIQKVAGHSSIKTTQGYTHISSNLISRVSTPINNILL